MPVDIIVRFVELVKMTFCNHFEANQERLWIIYIYILLRPPSVFPGGRGRSPQPKPLLDYTLHTHAPPG